MRLLNTTTYKLDSFQKPPPYAILSHVWQKEEVTFRDIADLDQAKKLQGFSKVAGACKIARKQEIEYIWIDTCCINKESSAELSEAINSMYNWYKDAKVCYAYLVDVSETDSYEDLFQSLMNTRWFTRGWTLQELIAPSKLIFFRADWADIGTKQSLQKIISFASRIRMEVITGNVVLNTLSVAEKMFWAVDRATTVVEDMAYSLMGIFGVNMPLLYGEGQRAFIRLQHEIMKKTDDHSIFAWMIPFTHTEGVMPGPQGILALGPRFFQSGITERFVSSPSENRGTNSHDILPPSTPFTITNRGLHIELPILQSSDGRILAFLNCHRPGSPEPLTITLKPHPLHSGIYIRSEFNNRSLTWDRKLWGDKIPQKRTPLYILDYIDPPEYVPSSYLTKFMDIRVEARLPRSYRKRKITPTGVIKWHNGFWVCRAGRNMTGLLIFEGSRFIRRFAVIFGVGPGSDGQEWCDILISSSSNGENGWPDLTAPGDSWVNERQHQDRKSVNVGNGWSVTVRTRADSDIQPGLRTAMIELNEITIPGDLPSRSDSKVVCLVVPPPASYGFQVMDNPNKQNPHLNPSSAVWYRHSGIFALFMDKGREDFTKITFKKAGGDPNDLFHLIIMGWNAGWRAFRMRLIESRQDHGVPREMELELDSSLCRISDIDGKRADVWATIRVLEGNDVADCIITLSITVSDPDEPKGVIS